MLVDTCGGDDYTPIVVDNVVVSVIGSGDAVFRHPLHFCSRPCHCCYHRRCSWDDGVLSCVDGISSWWC